MKLWSIKSFFLGLSNILGRRGVIWVIIGVINSVLLSFIEFVIAITMQLIFKYLGILSSEVSIPIVGKIPFDPKYLFLGLIVLGAVRSTCQFFVNQSSPGIQEAALFNLRIFLSKWALLDSTKNKPAAKDLTHYLSAIFRPTSFGLLYGSQCLANAVQALGILLIMFIVTYRETITILIGMSIIAAVVSILNRYVRQYAKNGLMYEEHFSTAISRSIQNWLLIKVFKTENLEFQNLVQSSEKAYASVIKCTIFANIGNSITPFLGILLILAQLWISNNIFHTDGSKMLIFLYLFIRLIQGLSVLVASFGAVNQYFASIKESITFVQSVESKPKEESKPPLTGSSPTPSIEFKGTSITRGHLVVLNNFNASIPMGQTTAIVGPSGSGKTTVLYSLIGLADVVHGSIEIGSLTKKISSLIDEVRIGYVGPEPFLHAGTLRSNIIYGTYGFENEDKIWEALKLSDIDIFVRSLDKKIDTEIGEGGEGLSTGQKQRICLARALYRNPSLLLLDEFSANLDKTSEHNILMNLELLKPAVTIVLITHNESALRFANHKIKLS